MKSFTKWVLAFWLAFELCMLPLTYYEQKRIYTSNGEEYNPWAVIQMFALLAPIILWFYSSAQTKEGFPGFVSSGYKMHLHMLQPVLGFVRGMKGKDLPGTHKAIEADGRLSPEQKEDAINLLTWDYEPYVCDSDPISKVVMSADTLLLCPADSNHPIPRGVVVPPGVEHFGRLETSEGVCFFGLYELYKPFDQYKLPDHIIRQLVDTCKLFRLGHTSILIPARMDERIVVKAEVLDDRSKTLMTRWALRGAEDKANHGDVIAYLQRLKDNITDDQLARNSMMVEAEIKKAGAVKSSKAPPQPIERSQPQQNQQQRDSSDDREAHR